MQDNTSYHLNAMNQNSNILQSGVQETKDFNSSFFRSPLSNKSNFDQRIYLTDSKTPFKNYTCNEKNLTLSAFTPGEIKGMNPILENNENRGDSSICKNNRTKND